jgi:hypothetical protein
MLCTGNKTKTGNTARGIGAYDRGPLGDVVVGSPFPDPTKHTNQKEYLSVFAKSSIGSKSANRTREQKSGARLVSFGYNGLPYCSSA